MENLQTWVIMKALKELPCSHSPCWYAGTEIPASIQRVSTLRSFGTQPKGPLGLEWGDTPHTLELQWVLEYPCDQDVIVIFIYGHSENFEVIWWTGGLFMLVMMWLGFVLSSGTLGESEVLEHSWVGLDGLLVRLWTVGEIMDGRWGSERLCDNDWPLRQLWVERSSHTGMVRWHNKVSIPLFLFVKPCVCGCWI